METTKTSKEAFKLYKRWEKALLSADLDLPKGCSKMGLVAYCFAMAIHGTNGIDCFASDALIAEELDLYHRDTVTKYRHAAIDFGWLAYSGKSHGRVQGLNIAIPSPKPPIDAKPREDEYRSAPEQPKPAQTVEQDDPSRYSIDELAKVCGMHALGCECHLCRYLMEH